MRTVKQVSRLTGISVRTLQFYDGIGLFKPTQVTQAGYRLYDDASLEQLQQILFFKELDFTLKEIKQIVEDPHFDRREAFQKQRALLQMKRDRLDRLLGLLDGLEKGEKNMSFEAFDLSGYFQALEELKKTHTDKIADKFGSLDHFDELVNQMKAKDTGEAGKIAVKLYGSIEKYTDAMRRNLTKYLEDGVEPPDAERSIQRTQELTRALTEDLSRDPGSEQVQRAVGELIAFSELCSQGMDMGENHWGYMAEQYLTNPMYVRVTDQKYGQGASEFIGKALRAFLEQG